MKTRLIILYTSLLLLAGTILQAQVPFVDCSCLATQAVLRTNACLAFVPDLCLFTKCYVPPGGPPPPVICSQMPGAGTGVGPGTTTIKFTISNPSGAAQSCFVDFVVTPPAPGTFAVMCAPNKTVDCTGWSFDGLTATNACCRSDGTPPVITLTSVTTTNGVCPRVYTRIWTARDDCGQTSTCSQTVTTIDTNPPTITCGGNQTVGCEQAWGFSAPNISDGCNSFSDLVLSIVSTTTNLTCGQGYVATRVWKVTDLCGNSANCTQVVTVLDNKPPVINCPSDLLLACGNTWSFGTPTAHKTCLTGVGDSNVVVAVVSTATNSLCPLIVTRTWRAIDVCGNTNQCSQTVTVGGPGGVLLDCSSLVNSPLLQSNDCQSVVPSLCPYILPLAQQNCPCTLSCSQTPAAGTPVGPGTYPITVTITDNNGGVNSCVLNYVVTLPPGLTNVYNTGMGGASGNIPLAANVTDPNYQLISVPPGGCNGPAQVLPGTSLPGQWLPNGPNSQWIGAGPTALCQPGVYHYRLCFYVPCTENASVLGQWTADDFGEILFNGQPIGNVIPSPQFPFSFTGWHPIAITNGFVCGTNCLDFYVTNAFAFDNPTGFRAELTNVFYDCCCRSQTALSVFSGLDAAGLLQPIGASDPQLTLTCVPPGVGVMIPLVVNPNPLWIPNGPNSQWIGPDVNNNAPDGVYCYTLGFNLPPCPDGLATYSVFGRWSADDTGTLFLNGSPTANTLPAGWAFTNWQAINFSTGLVPGLNTLTFYVTNTGGATGLRLELAGTATCCACTNCLLAITCPANLTNIICGNTGILSYPLATATSSCGDAPNVVCTPTNGATVPVGNTTVTCIATGMQGGSTNCSFNVSVIPNPTPWTVQCPPLNLSVTGCPPRLPDLFALATIVTNCPINGGLTYTNFGPSGVMTNGTPLPPGQTTVILHICDSAGNCKDCDVIITAVLSPNCCMTTPVLNLFSGVNSSGPLPGGALDPQFKTGAPFFTTPSPYVASVIHSLWLPNTAVSKWIGPITNAGGFYGSPGGVYVYTNRFFLCSTNQAVLSGRWTADDSGAIWLNGVPTGNILPASWSFTNWHPVSITSGFVPGWNTLTFRVTNGLFSVTGLRTEITGRACCNNCVSIACPSNLTNNTCSSSTTVNYLAPTATSVCGSVPAVACAPPSGSSFPLGTNVVTCTAIDGAGNSATCSFNITVRPIALPVILNCPPNQTLLVCATSSVAYFKTTASGQTGPVLCTPPSGSVFPVGTNVVTCTATNACGLASSCSFVIVVKNHLLGPPDATFTAGFPDNFAQPPESSPPSACMITAFSGFSFWKGFDSNAINNLFGHRFTGLPTGIVKAELVTRMVPTSDIGSDNDGIFVGLPTCAFSSFLWSASIKTLPGAGGTWLPGHAATTFTFDLGALNPALLTHMNTAQLLDVVVHDDTTVDYMQLRLWRCPPPQPGIGIPYYAVNGATAALLPDDEARAIGPTLCVFPNPSVSDSGVTLQPGGAKAITFSTVLDLNPPENAKLDLMLPPDPAHPAGTPLMSWRSKGAKGYCVKTSTKFTDDPDTQYRSIAIGTNGELFSSFTWDQANAETNVLLNLNHLPGVTSVVMTVTFDLLTREISLEFPHCIWTPDNARKGWDGCIYGNSPPGRGKGSARLIFTPAPPHTPPPPVFEASLLATGLSVFSVEDPSINALGRKWGDGHVTLMKAYDDGEELSFISVGEGGGVNVELGHAASFEVGLHHFEDGGIPDAEQVFLMRGINPLALTNRPTPPKTLLRLMQIAEGVACTVDFSDLGAQAVTVQLFNAGVFAGQGTGSGPTIGIDNPLVLDRWPMRLGQTASNGVVRLTSVEPLTISGLVGDEVRIIPILPAGQEMPAYLDHLECLARDGMDNLLYNLQRTLACPPSRLTIIRTAGGISLSWPGEGYTLQAAENVTGPWYDLGNSSPLSVGPSAATRFYRLVCQ